MANMQVGYKKNVLDEYKRIEDELLADLQAVRAERKAIENIVNRYIKADDAPRTPANTAKMEKAKNDFYELRKSSETDVFGLDHVGLVDIAYRVKYNV
jgi:hypothetical protein